MGGVIYFVTVGLHPQVKDERFLSEEEIQIIYESILYWHQKKWILYSFSILPDHFHLIASPLLICGDEWNSLPDILASVKKYTARKINEMRNRKGRFWLEESYDRIIRSESDFTEKMLYILNNAVKLGIIENGFDYFGYWWEGKQQ